MTAPARARRPLPTQEARGGSRPGAVLPAVTAMALLLACAPVSVLFTDTSWIWVVALTVAAVCGTGGLLRALPVPLLLVPFAQTAAFAAVITWFLTRADPGTGGPVGALRALRDLVSQGIAAVRDSVAPVEPTPGLLALLAVLVFLVALLVETLAVGLGLAGLAGLALLVPAAAPLGIRPDGPLLLLLAAPACGWLLLLAADQAVRLRPPSARRQRPTGRPWAGALGMAAAGVAGTAMVLAVAGPPVVEAPWLRSWWNDTASGAGAGGGSSLDPFVSVRSQLDGRAGDQLLQYSSSDGAPTYLSLVTLEAFDGTMWSPYPPSPSVPLDRPAPGAGEQAPAATTYDISVTTLDNLYLPVPDAVTEVALEEPTGWGWDPRTGDAVGSARSASGLQYRAGALARSPDPAALAAATSDSPQVSRTTRAVPPAMPVEVADIAAEVTSGATSNYDRAVALQSWFASQGGFRYSLNVPNPGERDPLLAFLQDRVGFCQQYATAMAVMARTLGIPARVVVGFTGGTPGSGSTFVVTGADAHAWPELWFDGIGWVRFEPTPASASDAVAAPAYTGQDQQPQPSQAPSSEPETAEPTTPADPAALQPTGPAAPAFAGLWGWLLGALLLAAVWAVPWLLRQRRRRARFQRLRRGDPAAGWLEIADTAIDAGLTWPTGATMRQQAEELARAVSAAGGRDVGDALHRLVRAAEERLYAPAGAAARSAASAFILDEPAVSADDATADVELVVKRLEGLPRSTWLRIWPRSLFARRSAT